MTESESTFSDSTVRGPDPILTISYSESVSDAFVDRVVETLAESDLIEPTKLPFESGGGYVLLNEAQESRRRQRQFCAPLGGAGILEHEIRTTVHRRAMHTRTDRQPRYRSRAPASSGVRRELRGSSIRGAVAIAVDQHSVAV